MVSTFKVLIMNNLRIKSRVATFSGNLHHPAESPPFHLLLYVTLPPSFPYMFIMVCEVLQQVALCLWSQFPLLLSCHHGFLILPQNANCVVISKLWLHCLTAWNVVFPKYYPPGFPCNPSRSQLNYFLTRKNLQNMKNKIAFFLLPLYFYFKRILPNMLWFCFFPICHI